MREILRVFIEDGKLQVTYSRPAKVLGYDPLTAHDSSILSMIAQVMAGGEETSALAILDEAKRLPREHLEQSTTPMPARPLGPAMTKLLPELKRVHDEEYHRQMFPKGSAEDMIRRGMERVREEHEHLLPRPGGMAEPQIKYPRCPECESVSVTKEGRSHTCEQGHTWLR